MPHKVNDYYFSSIKSLFDLSFGLLIFIFISPLILLISLLIFIKSGWPVFFIQKRMGKNGKNFFIYKFRTMCKDAHKQQIKLKNLNQAPGPMFKIFDDPRFVGIGKFLSSTGLDELPQIINILKGEMSFIGPRPLPVAEAKKLNSNWEFRKVVKPGIFSEWTLMENRHHSLHDWKRLDQQTLVNGGIIYDLRLIFLTLLKVLKRF